MSLDLLFCRLSQLFEPNTPIYELGYKLYANGYIYSYKTLLNSKEYEKPEQLLQIKLYYLYFLYLKELPQIDPITFLFSKVLYLKSSLPADAFKIIKKDILLYLSITTGKYLSSISNIEELMVISSSLLTLSQANINTKKFRGIIKQKINQFTWSAINNLNTQTVLPLFSVISQSLTLKIPQNESFFILTDRIFSLITSKSGFFDSKYFNSTKQTDFPVYFKEVLYHISAFKLPDDQISLLNRLKDYIGPFIVPPQAKKKVVLDLNSLKKKANLYRTNKPKYFITIDLYNSPEGEIVVKSFKSNLETPDFSQVMKEIEILKTLSSHADSQNNCFLKFYASKLNKNKVVIAMEYFSQTLSAKLEKLKKKNKFFDLDQVYSWAKILIQSFAFMSGLGILHRDIKPSNILYSKKALKIIDFGAAEITQTGDILYNDPDSFSVVGTEQFMSPELLSAHKQGKNSVPGSAEKSDVFSLGLCLLSLCATSTLETLNMTENRERLEGVIWKVNHEGLKTLLPKMLCHDNRRRLLFYELLGSFQVEQTLDMS